MKFIHDTAFPRREALFIECFRHTKHIEGSFIILTNQRYKIQGPFIKHDVALDMPYAYVAFHSYPQRSLRFFPNDMLI